MVKRKRAETGERDPCWMHYSDLWAHLWAGRERPPASDHRGVMCAQQGSLSAPHRGPNDVWNVLIKSCLFIRLTIGFMGRTLSGLASYCPQGNPPDRVSSPTTQRQIPTWGTSIHLNGPLSVVAACHAAWLIRRKCLMVPASICRLQRRLHQCEIVCQLMSPWMYMLNWSVDTGDRHLVTNRSWLPPQIISWVSATQ